MKEVKLQNGGVRRIWESAGMRFILELNGDGSKELSFYGLVGLRPSLIGGHVYSMPPGFVPDAPTDYCPEPLGTRAQGPGWIDQREADAWWEQSVLSREVREVRAKGSGRTGRL